MIMTSKRTIRLLALWSITLLLCVFVGKAQATWKKEFFGRTAGGQLVELYTLTNRNGVEARISTYGGVLVSLKVPDRTGKLDDVVLGFDKLEGYLNDTKYIGALIGRYANRIAKGQFMLNGVEHKLATNNNENHLHGGVKGFDKVVWKARPVKVPNGDGVELSYLSRDGEEGYPGNLTTRVVYTLTNRNELKIDYYLTTDRDTIANLTQHSYFNLAGQGHSDILGHQLKIDADSFTPTDAVSIPTGELRSVKGTPFDFTQMMVIGARIGQVEEQLKFGNGYDHNFVINGRAGTLRQAAKVFEPTTGRVLEVWTTEPGMQFYTGNFLDGSQTGKGGKTYQRRSAFCLETQHFPDSPNHTQFPSTVLRRGGRYQTTTVYRFSAK